MGEFNTARGIIEEFKDDYFIFLTYFSPRARGYLESQRSYYHYLHPLPLDVPPLVKKLERTVNPRALIVVERELWPSLIKFTDVKKALINAYAKGGILERFLSKHLDLVITKTRKDEERFRRYGVKSILTCGNLKLLLQGRQTETVLRSKGRFLVAGSTHKEEEEIILRAYSSLKKEFQNLKLILAPRHMDRVQEVEKLLLGFNYSLRSKEKDDWDILLVDTLGELFNLYSFADLCFVGGTFRKIGGHNLLEPIYWRKPVVFGPYTHKVRDMEEFLLQNGLGFKVKDEKDLEKTLRYLLKNVPRIDFDLKEYASSVRECYMKALKEFIGIV